MSLTVWDVAVGFLIAFLLMGGLVYGAVKDDKGVFSICSILTGFLILWRIMVWNADDPTAIDSGIIAVIAHMIR